MTTQKQKLDVTSLLDNCLDRFEDLMQLEKINLVKEMTNDSLEVFGDEYGLQKVFGYLILNAIEAMEGKNQKLLTVRSSIGQGWVAVDIEYSGCGIIEASSKEFYGSSAIPEKNDLDQGLQIVKCVVQHRGGKIRVNGRGGQGAAITVQLPINHLQNIIN